MRDNVMGIDKYKLHWKSVPKYHNCFSPLPFLKKKRLVLTIILDVRYTLSQGVKDGQYLAVSGTANFSDHRGR